jgi:hypothetical protein
MKNTIVLTITIFSLFISGCASSIMPSTTSSDDCIPPLFNIALPTIKGNMDTSPREVAPRGNWMIQDKLPFDQNELGHLIIRKKQNEIWLTDPIINKIFRYLIDDSQWLSYPVVGWTLNTLFVSNDGTVWSGGLRIENSDGNEDYFPILSRFNDLTDSFEYVEDTTGILRSPQVRLISNIVEDNSGTLWFFVEGEEQTLVSFNTKTNESRQHYSLNKGDNRKLSIQSDGTVWFGDVFKNQIIRYIPYSQEVQVYSGYPEPAEFGGLGFDLSEVNYLFFDKSERLWLANKGWLDISNGNSPIWNQVLDSPVFITEVDLPYNEYALSYQYSTYQSSNGWYWFTGGSGIVKLDLEQGSWCLMTTGISEVVEDKNNDLWIAVFNHLYKYSLE